MEDKEKLVTLKYVEIFEAVQRENRNKRRELAEQFSQRNTFHSGAHEMAIIKLELDCIKKLLDANFRILLEVYYRNSKPWTNNDEIFLMKRIEKLFQARFNASQNSLRDYLNQIGLRGLSEDFEREANSIYFNSSV